MSNAIFELKANVREDMGKGASRRLRREHKQIPAIVYGGKEKPLSIKLEHNKVIHALEHEAFYSHILTLIIDEKKQKVVLKDLQRHPYKRAILHMDFQRVSDNYIISMKVPLHFTNEDKCKGAKEGGVISHHMNDLNIRCKAKDLPEYIEIDLENIDIDQAIHLSDISLPNGVEIPELTQDLTHNVAIVSVHAPKKVAESAPTEEATSTAEGEADKANAEENKS